MKAGDIVMIYLRRDIVAPAILMSRDGRKFLEPMAFGQPSEATGFKEYIFHHFEKGLEGVRFAHYYLSDLKDKQTDVEVYNNPNYPYQVIL